MFHCAVNGRLDVNVALNRPSYLSSTYTNSLGTYNPSRGNDGDKTRCNGVVASNSVAISNSELNPWYGVDLGVALRVTGVKFTNREDGTGGRYSQY